MYGTLQYITIQYKRCDGDLVKILQQSEEVVGDHVGRVEEVGHRPLVPPAQVFPGPLAAVGL